MRRIARPVPATVLVAILFAACAPAMVNPGSEEQAIRAQTSAWQRAIAARDVDRIVAMHTPDAMVMVSNSPASQGTAAIRAAWTGMLGAPGLQLGWTPAKIDIVSPTVATDVGTYTMSFDTPQGRTSDRGSYTTIWHKVDGQWKVAVDAAVSATPLPAPMTSGAMVMDASETEMAMRTGLTWAPLNVPGFDPGVRIAVLHGDPGKTGDYTVRLEFPDGYRFPVHWHPNGEHLTVLTGTFQLAMGNTADWSAVRTYEPGDFLYLPARHAHFGGAKGQTVVQLHGEGPFQIMLGAGR